MSIFGTIMSKIFHHQAAPAAAAPTPDVMPDAAPAADTSFDAPVDTAQTSISQVDVEGVLTQIAAQYNHPVNWKYSIVDLLAILGIDNSLAQRKELATELGYTGDMSDSATMNVWLHKEVMRKLAENGGMVPADLMG